MRRAGFVLALVLALAPGCEKSMAPVCRDVCACSHCTDNDFDACVTKGAAAQTAADKKGCLDAFDTFVDCFETNVSCQEGAGAGTNQCVRAEMALLVCAGAGSPFASLCEEAQIKTDVCNGTTTTLPAGTQCIGVAACNAGCTVKASCDALTGATSDPTFNTCVMACQMKSPPPPGD